MSPEDQPAAFTKSSYFAPRCPHCRAPFETWAATKIHVKDVRSRTPAAPEDHMNGFPDLDYIRKEVPIEEIAKLLDFEVHHHHMRCFRPEQHQHGDRTPSFSFYPKSNRAQCHCCDPYAYSNLDFVMKVLGVELWPAIQWVCERFPDVPRNSKRGRPHSSQPVRAGLNVYGGALEKVIRSGFYGKLRPSTRSLLSVLVGLQDENAQIEYQPYEALMQLAGIGSRTTLGKALRELENPHAIKTGKRQRDDGPGQRNIYTLTLDDPEFRAYLDVSSREDWHAFVQDREARRQYRKLRQHKPKLAEKSQS